MYLKYVHIYEIHQFSSCNKILRITENLKIHENILLSEKSPCDIIYQSHKNYNNRIILNYNHIHNIIIISNDYNDHHMMSKYHTICSHNLIIIM